MTRTDVMASSRPSTADVAPTRRRSSVWRRLSIAAVVLAVALLPSVAAAEEPTSGYKQTPTVSKTTPSSGVSPSQEEKPTSTSTTTTPTTSEAAEKASTLPFTGFDLRWDLGLGLLLIAAGVSIVVLQRRHRRESRR